MEKKEIKREDAQLLAIPPKAAVRDLLECLVGSPKVKVKKRIQRLKMLLDINTRFRSSRFDILEELHEHADQVLVAFEKSEKTRKLDAVQLYLRSKYPENPYGCVPIFEPPPADFFKREIQASLTSQLNESGLVYDVANQIVLRLRKECEDDKELGKLMTSRRVVFLLKGGATTKQVWLDACKERWGPDAANKIEHQLDKVFGSGDNDTTFLIDPKLTESNRIRKS